jgi:hypothetical protein
LHNVSQRAQDLEKYAAQKEKSAPATQANGNPAPKYFHSKVVLIERRTMGIASVPDKASGKAPVDDPRLLKPRIDSTARATQAPCLYWPIQ